MSYVCSGPSAWTYKSAELDYPNSHKQHGLEFRVPRVIKVMLPSYEQQAEGAVEPLRGAAGDSVSLFVSFSW